MEKLRTTVYPIVVSEYLLLDTDGILFLVTITPTFLDQQSHHSHHCHHGITIKSTFFIFFALNS